MQLSKKEVFDYLKNTIVEVAKISEDRVEEESSFSDLDVDSLGIVEIVVISEIYFKVKISDEDVTKLTCIDDLVNLIVLLSK